jgi:hypothetical protein
VPRGQRDGSSRATGSIKFKYESNVWAAIFPDDGDTEDLRNIAFPICFNTAGSKRTLVREVRKNCVGRLLASALLSVRLCVWNISALTTWICLTGCIGVGVGGLVHKSQFYLKPEKYYGHLKPRPKCVFLEYLALCPILVTSAHWGCHENEDMVIPLINFIDEIPERARNVALSSYRKGLFPHLRNQS